MQVLLRMTVTPPGGEEGRGRLLVRLRGRNLGDEGKTNELRTEVLPGVALETTEDPQPLVEEMTGPAEDSPHGESVVERGRMLGVLETTEDPPGTRLILRVGLGEILTVEGIDPGTLIVLDLTDFGTIADQGTTAV